MTDHTAARMAALALLGLPDLASAGDITRAYRRLAKTTHPDLTGALDHDAGHRFAALTQAYRLLTSTPAPPSPPTPTAATATTPAPGSPDPASPSRPTPITVRFTRPPISAGPVRITPPPPTSRRRP